MKLTGCKMKRSVTEALDYLAAPCSFVRVFIRESVASP